MFEYFCMQVCIYESAFEPEYEPEYERPFELHIRCSPTAPSLLIYSSPELQTQRSAKEFKRFPGISLKFGALKEAS